MDMAKTVIPATIAAPDPASPSQKRDWAAFAREIDSIRAELHQSDGVADYRQFRKMELWGRLSTLLGYATAWIAPNPLSAYLISQGNFARWSVAFHQISHGAFDHYPHVPDRHKSFRFAQGARRFLDWFDWITPRNWDDEHNRLHHYHLGSPKDPDVVERNSAYIRAVSERLWVRRLLAFAMACAWKPVYYAVNTLAESLHYRGKLPTSRIGWRSWSLSTPEGRELWLTCLLPYAAFRFVLLPLLFLPLGPAASASVFLSSVLAELLTNLHSFATIGPNHTGDDVYNFSDSPRGKAEHYLRQILGTVNYPAGGDLADFLYGGMNYQVEHHLWPEATMLQCRQLRPRVKSICRSYGIPYREELLLARLVQTFGVMAGTRRQAQITSAESLA